jgi:hypothetical protein
MFHAGVFYESSWLHSSVDRDALHAVFANFNSFRMSSFSLSTLYYQPLPPHRDHIILSLRLSAAFQVDRVHLYSTPSSQIIV